MLVAIDKFTKWIKYKAITKLSADRVVSFICDILHRFGSLTLSLRIWDPISTHTNSRNSASAAPLRSTILNSSPASQWPG
jgi:hypothetical protein